MKKKITVCLFYCCNGEKEFFQERFQHLNFCKPINFNKKVSRLILIVRRVTTQRPKSREYRAYHLSVNNKLPMGERNPAANQSTSISIMRVIRANSRAFGAHICGCVYRRVRTSPTIPSRSAIRPGQCIPTRIIHRGHYSRCRTRALLLTYD